MRIISLLSSLFFELLLGDATSSLSLVHLAPRSRSVRSAQVSTWNSASLVTLCLKKSCQILLLSPGRVPSNTWHPLSYQVSNTPCTSNLAISSHIALFEYRCWVSKFQLVHPVTTLKQVKSSKDILDRTRTAIDALKASSFWMVCITCILYSIHIIIYI